MVTRVRAMQGAPEVADRGWSNGAALDLVAAYDAERAKLSRIAAILSDDSLENPQKIGRALRVAEEQA